MDAGLYRIVIHAIAQSQTKIENALIDIERDCPEIASELRRVQRALDTASFAADQARGIPPPWVNHD